MAGASPEIKGGEQLERRLAEIARKLQTAQELRVGFLEDATYPNGTPVALVAAATNWGVPAKGIPPRPFFSNMVEREQGGWPDLIAHGLQRSGGDARSALEFTGQIIKEQLQASILAPDYVADSPVTDLLKQRFPMGGQTFADVQQARRDVAAGETAPVSKTLVHTSNMLNSVAFEVL